MALGRRRCFQNSEDTCCLMHARAVEHDTHATPFFSVCFLPYRATGLDGWTLMDSYPWTGGPGPFLIESLVFSLYVRFSLCKKKKKSPLQPPSLRISILFHLPLQQNIVFTRVHGYGIFELQKESMRRQSYLCHLVFKQQTHTNRKSTHLHPKKYCTAQNHASQANE